MNDNLDQSRTTLEPRIPRAVLRQLIKAHGGKFHGPKVEHLSMEEGAFWHFMYEVIEFAWKRKRLELLT